MKLMESLEELASSLNQCFIANYHQGITITPRPGRSLLATWWFDRAGYKPRRWEVSIRFPGNLVDRYAVLDDAGKSRANTHVRDAVSRFVGNLESLEEGHIRLPASYVCDLDEQMFD
ncbi:MAG: hypothetical protein ACLPXB_19720 [Thiobacillaceae bacterium]